MGVGEGQECFFFLFFPEVRAIPGVQSFFGNLRVPGSAIAARGLAVNQSMSSEKIVS